MAHNASIRLDDKEFTLSVLVGSEGEKAIDTRKLRADTGFICYDQGYGNTGSCESAITYLDGDNGILTAVPSYDEAGYFAMANSSANILAGGPQIIAGPGLGLSTYTPGGLITSGALKGTYFGQVGANGAASINQLAYGSPATGQWMQGGDWQYTDSGQFGKTGLVPTQKRQNAFGRVSFDLSDDAEVYAEASYGRYWADAAGLDTKPRRNTTPVPGHARDTRRDRRYGRLGSCQTLEGFLAGRDSPALRNPAAALHPG